MDEAIGQIGGDDAELSTAARDTSQALLAEDPNRSRSAEAFALRGWALIRHRGIPLQRRAA